VKTEEDEAWEDLERAQGWRKRQIADKVEVATCPQCERFKESAANWRRKAYELNGTPLPAKQGDDYESGWNAALEMAAFKLQHEFRQAFGEDTLASIAVYIKGMKK
jgi:hypothetical protein